MINSDPAERHDTPPPRAPWLVSCPTCGNLTRLYAPLCTRCGCDNPGHRPVREREHHHRRDRYCSTMFPAPMTPTKPVSIWLFAFADAIQHHETLVEFVEMYPAEFPTIGGAR